MYEQKEFTFQFSKPCKGVEALEKGKKGELVEMTKEVEKLNQEFEYRYEYTRGSYYPWDSTDETEYVDTDYKFEAYSSEDEEDTVIVYATVSMWQDKYNLGYEDEIKDYALDDFVKILGKEGFKYDYEI